MKKPNRLHLFRQNSFSSTYLLLALVLYGALLAACTGNAAPVITLHVADTATPPSTDVPVVIVATVTPIRYRLPTDARLQNMFAAIQSDQLVFVIDTLSNMGTRHVLSAGFDPVQGLGITAARNFLLDQFRSIPFPASLAVWTQPINVRLNGITATSENVIAVAQGTDLNAGVIVIGAHYDSLNASDINSADLAAPGANDNGSGVAALLEIARLVAVQPMRTTIIFAAFTAEETGRQGSNAFIRSYLQAQTPAIVPRAMINLDILGASLPSGATPDSTDDDTLLLPGVVRVFSADPNDSPSRQLARQIQLSAAPYSSIPRVIVQSSAERLGRFGDQQPFSTAGIAAVRLIEGMEDPGRQRSAADTPDGIRPGYLIGATRVALAAVLSLADGLPAPRDVQWQPTANQLRWSPVQNAAGYIVTLRHVHSAAIEQTVVIGSAPVFQWTGFSGYDFAAVAPFDSAGRIGELAPETRLSHQF